MPEQTNRDTMMNVKEAARIIGCCEQNIRHLIRKGILQATKVMTDLGHYYLLDPTEVERYRIVRYNTGWQRGRPRSEEDKQGRRERSR